MVTATTCMTINATEFKIIALNTPTIEIGGQNLTKGDRFSDSESISWQSPRQAMKVVNLSTKEQSLIVSERFAQTKSKSLSNYLKASKNLSTRSGKLNNVVAIGSYLNGNFYLDDSITVKTTFPTDNNRFFFIAYDRNGETINKRIQCLDGAFTLTKEIFSIDGKGFKPEETTVSVFYYDTSIDALTLLSNNMNIIPIDLQ